MGLRVILHENKVRIPKFNEEFPLVLPKKELEEQALRIISFLQNSPYLQMTLDTSHQKQIFTVLQSYGEALFQAIIPKNYQQQLQNFVNPNRELEICIYFIPWYEIHWELLHNGKNWHSLDAGVKRIYMGKAKMRHFESPASWHFFSAPIAYGRQRTPTCEFYQTPIEWLQPEYKEQLSRFVWNFHLQADHHQLQNSLLQKPRYMYLEGFHDLEKFCFAAKKYEISKSSIERLAFESAIECGLELLVCNLKPIRERNNKSYHSLLNIFFGFGLPYFVDFVGSLHKRVMAVYMENFLLSLVQGQKIDFAYWKALKAIAQGGSWDWIWIRFWQNDKKIVAQQSQTNYEVTNTKNDLFFAKQDSWNLRRFYGSLYSLEALEKKLIQTEQSCLVCDQYFQNAENFFTQFAIKKYQEISTINIFFLPSTFFFSPKNTSQKSHSFSQDIQDYLLKNNQTTIFDYQNLNNPEKKGKKLLLIYFPFTKQSVELLSQEVQKQFFLWISTRGEDSKNYSLVFVSYDLTKTKYAFLLKPVSVSDSLKFFDFDSQTTIENRLQQEIFSKNIFVSYRLLKMLFLLKINSLSKDFNQDKLWSLVLLHFQRKINKRQKQILTLCFLFPIALSFDFLQQLLGKEIRADIELLYSYHLLEKNSIHSKAHIEGGLKYLMAKNNFFTQQQVHHAHFIFVVFLSQKRSFFDPQIFFSFLFHYFPNDFILQNEIFLEAVYQKSDSWKLKKIFYAKLFEKIHYLPNNRELKWVSRFYQDALHFSKDIFWVQKLQSFIDLLEEKEEWDLFFSSQLTICNFFISQQNFQKVKNLLAPLIELSKSGIFSSKKIIEIALLLIKIGDDKTYLSLLEHFSNIFQQQTKHLDLSILNAYQLFLQGKRREFLTIITYVMKDNSTLSVIRYCQVYQKYIKYCGEQQQIENLYFFLIQLEKEFHKIAYHNYQVLIASIFTASVINKTKYNLKLAQNFFPLLEKCYSFAKISKDEQITKYADILGQLYYQVGDEKKYKTYLEEVYKKPL